MRAVTILCMGLLGIVVGPWLLWNLRLGLWARLTPQRKIRPRRNPLQHCGRAYVDFWATTADGLRLRGWYVPGEPGWPAVVLCHPYDSSKYASLHRLALLPPGCPALLFDCRAHGESEGQFSELLAGEQRDVTAALEHARSRWGLQGFVLWGRCWNTVALANLAVERADVVGLILEGVMPSLWDASNQQLEHSHELPPWFFRVGYALLERRWGRGLRSRPLHRLPLGGLPVLLITEGRHGRGVRYAARLRAAWSAARELRVPALHGEITDLAAAAGQVRERMASELAAWLPTLHVPAAPRPPAPP